MSTLIELQERREMREALHAIGTPQALADLQQLQRMQHASEQLQLGADAYQSAADRGKPPSGWMRASENLEELKRQIPALAGMSDKVLMNYLKPDADISGFRAEIYLPDPEILGPGYKPTVAFKGSSGPIMMANGKTRESVA